MKIKNGLKIAVSLFLTGILSSCASHRPPQQPTASLSTPALSPEEAWKENQINLNRIDSWYSEGRIAVSRQHEGESASFIWQQFPEAFFLKLFGPFGSGAMELEGTLTGPDKQVVMRQGNKLNYAATAEDLLYQQVKWRVPLSGLTHWAKGVPVPNQPIDKMILNSNGTIKEVNQLGWHITYSQYSQFENNQLPTKMHLINNELEVKLAIRNWSHIK
jgi:outer membrane lipoprotein LolB